MIEKWKVILCAYKRATQGELQEDFFYKCNNMFTLKHMAKYTTLLQFMDISFFPFPFAKYI